MCGIAGFFDSSCSPSEAQGRLEEMLQLLVHRGPDTSGTHFENGLALGMRRLSIIDLEGGAQPVWNEDGSIGVIFNGEIYNYVELTNSLMAKGHRFQTASDTEVLVHLYEEAGLSLFEHLRGMFAFALLDHRNHQLLLARDHFGQKPLYYTSAGERFAFASELKSLFALPWVNRDSDPEAFLDYLSWFSLPPPRTHFRNISKLSAGSFLMLPLDGSPRRSLQKYWSYDLTETPDLSTLPAATGALDAALRDSVRIHLRADVPVGVLLSSGLDSRTVAAYAQDLQRGEMQTFTVGFGAEDSELEGAAETAREIRSQHHALELTPADLADHLEKIAWHLDEPIADPACFAVLKVCELAREHVKVLLSGEGADELFAGYEGRYHGILSTLHRSEPWRLVGKLLPEADPGATPNMWQRFLRRAHHTRGSEAVGLRVEGLPGDVRHPRGFNQEQLQRLDERTAFFAESVYRPQRDRLSELLALDLDWQLAESLLQKADKMSMAASIELRTPLLDIGVAKIAARIPSELKLPPTGPGKMVLRQTLAQKLNEPLDRPKKGFPVPLAEWLRGPLRANIEAAILNRQAHWLQHLDEQLVCTAWGEFLDGEWDGARVFYALWLYEIWQHAIVNQPARSE